MRVGPDRPGRSASAPAGARRWRRSPRAVRCPGCCRARRGRRPHRGPPANSRHDFALPCRWMRPGSKPALSAMCSSPPPATSHASPSSAISRMTPVHANALEAKWTSKSSVRAANAGLERADARPDVVDGDDQRRRAELAGEVRGRRSRRSRGGRRLPGGCRAGTRARASGRRRPLRRRILSCDARGPHRAAGRHRRARRPLLRAVPARGGAPPAASSFSTAPDRRRKTTSTSRRGVPRCGPRRRRVRPARARGERRRARRTGDRRRRDDRGPAAGRRAGRRCARSSMGGRAAARRGRATLDAAAVVAICPASGAQLRRGLDDRRFPFRADPGSLAPLLETTDLSAAAATLGERLLLMHAEGDEDVPVEHSRALHAAAPASRIEVVPGGHHRSVQHDPDLQALAVRFIAGPPARRGDRGRALRPPRRRVHHDAPRGSADRGRDRCRCSATR